jgi:hypothetical protein
LVSKRTGFIAKNRVKRCFYPIFSLKMAKIAPKINLPSMLCSKAEFFTFAVFLKNLKKWRGEMNI